MKRTHAYLAVLLTAGSLAGCASTETTVIDGKTQTTHVVDELETPGSPLRQRLEKAAEHLPPGSSIEEQTRQAEIEAEQAEAAHMTPAEAARVLEHSR